MGCFEETFRLIAHDHSENRSVSMVYSVLKKLNGYSLFSYFFISGSVLSIGLHAHSIVSLPPNRFVFVFIQITYTLNGGGYGQRVKRDRDYGCFCRFILFLLVF